MAAPSEASLEPRGLLIVFEGLDRSGKSTQCQLLADSLAASGHKVKHMRFPDRTTPTGTSINAYLTDPSTPLSDHAIHLLFSANRWEAAPSMLSALSSGTHLLVDRYSFSGAVYSAAKNNPNLSLDWAWKPEIGLPKPDAVVFLTVSEEVAEGRGGFGAERYESREMQRRVREGFGGIWRRVGMGEGEGKGRGLWVVDADRGVEEVRGRIEGVVLGLIGDEEGRRRPVGRFGDLLPPSV